jgi:hypothetical protein
LKYLKIRLNRLIAIGAVGNEKIASDLAAGKILLILYTQSEDNTKSHSLSYAPKNSYVLLFTDLCGKFHLGSAVYNMERSVHEYNEQTIWINLTVTSFGISGSNSISSILTSL